MNILAKLFYLFRKSVKTKRGMNPMADRASGNERKLIETCAMPSDAALKSLSTTEQGLNKSQVESLREEFGPNEISRGKRMSFLSGILRRFANPLVILLLIICAVSLSMGDLRSTIVVGGMILISVFLAYFQEAKSNQSGGKTASPGPDEFKCHQGREGN